MKVYKPSVALIYFYGLVVSERWERVTSKSFIQTHLKDFLKNDRQNPELWRLIDCLRQRAIRNHPVDKSPLIEDETSGEDDVLESVLQLYNWQVSNRKT